MGLGPIEKNSRLKHGPRFWVRADSLAKARALLPAFVEFDCGDIYKQCLPLKIARGGRVEYRRLKMTSVIRNNTWGSE